MYAISSELKFTFIAEERIPPEGFSPVTESLAFTAKDYFTGRYRKNLYTSFFKLTGKKELVVPGFYGETLFCIEGSVFEELFDDIFMGIKFENKGAPDAALLQVFICCT